MPKALLAAETDASVEGVSSSKRGKPGGQRKKPSKSAAASRGRGSSQVSVLYPGVFLTTSFCNTLIMLTYALVV